MNGLLVTGIVFAILLALSLIRIRILFEYDAAGARASIKILFFTVARFPTRKEEQAETMPKPPSAEPGEQKRSRGPLERLEEIFDLLLDAFGRFMRMLRIDLLDVDFVAGKREDAAAAALLYGKAWAVQGIILGILENNMTIRKKRIDIGVDYSADSSQIRCTIMTSVMIGRLMINAPGLLVRFLHGQIQKNKLNKGGAS